MKALGGNGLERRVRPSASVFFALLLCPAAHGAGFQVSEQGARAMAMANAFTAQADDPSAVYFNAAGLGFMNERELMAGSTLIALGDVEFRGVAPFPGPDASAGQRDNLLAPVHAYWVEPIRDDLTFGLGLTSPFGLITEWPEEFVGRFVARKAELRTWDLSPNVSWRAQPRLSIAVGAVLRASLLELQRSSAAINPFTFVAEEVARLRLDSDTEIAAGWSVGILHRVTDRFSWGFSYRSAIDVDYSGQARLTQVPTGDPLFDEEVRSEIPFDEELPVETGIEFPDHASLGLALDVGRGVRIEFDLNRAGWSAFDEAAIRFPENGEDDLDTRIVADWDDAASYRLGLCWSGARRGELRFGAYLDEDPQPRETLGPLLPDSDRVGYSAGYGFELGAIDLDVALMYVDLRDRTTRTNVDGLDGTYSSSIWILSATVRF